MTLVLRLELNKSVTSCVVPALSYVVLCVLFRVRYLCLARAERLNTCVTVSVLGSSAALGVAIIVYIVIYKYMYI